MCACMIRKSNMVRSRSGSRSPSHRVFTERGPERRRSRSRSRDRERRRDHDRRRSRSRSPRRSRRRSRSRSASPRRFRRSPSPRRRRSPSPRRSQRPHSRSPEKHSSDKEKESADMVLENSEGEDDPNKEDEAMMKMMGFSNFDTTKNKHVPGACNQSGLNVKKAHKYRQYMNRKGGFNRPLDYVT